MVLRQLSGSENNRKLFQHSDFFPETLFNHAQDLERQGNLESAAAVYHQLGTSPALARLRNIAGSGGFTLSRAQFLAGRFVDQVTDSPALLAMVGAQGTYRALSPLLGSLPAFAAEATMFPIYNRLGNEALGRPADWSRDRLSQDIQGSFLILGGLKAFGYLGGQGVGWWSRGRALSGTLADRLVTQGLPTVAMYAGILSGHVAEQVTGLAPSQAAGQMAAESLATLAHFIGAGRILPHLPQPRLNILSPLSGRNSPLFFNPLPEGVLSVWAPPRTLPWGPPTLTATPSGSGGRNRGAFRPAHVLQMESNGEGDNPGGRQPRATRPETPRARSKSSNPPPPEREPKGTPALPVPGAPPVPQLVERTFEKVEVTVDVGRGYKMVERALDQMDPQDLLRLRRLADKRPDQPWVMAGVSDGMGFHSTVALLASGMIRHGVGVFYEPPTLLKMGSEVHLARLARVEGLRILVDELGVDFPIFFEDVVLPRWGHPEGPKPFPVALMEGIEASQKEAAIPDINFVNSIAFARWISPSPGVEQRTGIPSVDLEGRVILMDMKPYREKQYQGTLDSMGRNHGVLLDALKDRFGPNSLSLFYTWAGGSQNFRILHGIYGGSSLGHAKEIGETDTVRFHLMSMADQMSYGAHKVVRFPDFLSHALFGIPGGGAFGLIAHNVLRNRGLYQGVPKLAAQAFIEALDGTHNLRNPLAQIELDTHETAQMKKGIEPLLNQFYRNVALYRRAHPEWDGKALDLETSRKLLGGLAAKDYREQLPKAWD